jgi:electron transfer flavoprotein alpha subunit
VLAVIVARDGVLPAGALETVSECDGHALVIGSSSAEAAAQLEHIADRVIALEVGDFRPAAWAELLADELSDEPIIVLPASADGRDLAPRLAARLDRPLYALAMTITADRVDLIRRGGEELHSIEPAARFVATLQPGVRGHDVRAGAAVVKSEARVVVDRSDADLEVLLPPDAATIDLSEADRIVAAGAGLDDPRRIDALAAFADALRASVGATRVITDRGWVGHERQIGTTGVIVAPKLYIAFGISGAVQHTSGLGQPAHIISVNTDPYCPMMQLADLALVARRQRRPRRAGRTDRGAWLTSTTS